jgi:uncharacterized protein
MAEYRRSRLICEVDLERDGVQHGFIRLFHSVHQSAYGFIPIPIVVIRNGEGPTALFSAGTHGDEYEGQVALCNMAKSLRPDRIRGRVILLPAANFPAAMVGRRTSPIDEGNLNRVFPGDPDGSVTEQIAYFIETELAAAADLICDLHSGGSSLVYVPTALIKRDTDAEMFARRLAMLRAFGAPHAYISVLQPGQGGDRTLGGRGARLSMGTELGGAGTVTPAALRIAERGLHNLLVHIGILPSEERIEPPAPTRIFDVGGQDYFVYAPEAGVFEPVVELGDMVRAGDLAARIHNPETPWAAPAEARFQHDGFVLCKRVPGRSVRGDCLFHLGTDAMLG